MSIEVVAGHRTNRADKNRGRRDFILSLLIPGAFFVLANLALSPLIERYPLNATYILVREQWQQVLEGHLDADFLILGDSSALHGVNPDTLDSLVGVRSLNLGTVGNLLAINDAWMLHTYVERKGPPKAVLIVHVVDVWNRPVEAVPFAKVPLRWGYWREAPTLYPFGLATVFKMSIIRTLPLSTDSESVAQYVLNPKSRLFETLESRVHGSLRRGFWRLPDRSDSQQILADSAAQLDFVRSHEPAISEPNRHALQSIGELTERLQFEAYLSVSPVYEALAASPEYRQFWESTRRRIIEVTSAYPRVHVIPDIPTARLDELTDTVDHLSGTAADRFTRRLAMVVSAGGGLHERGPEYRGFRESHQ